jgi:flagellar hook-associated protein 1 FlgK
MSLSAAYTIINSAFLANAAQSAVISSNISNANTTGYAREVANSVTTSYGGSEVASVTREVSSALTEQANAATSDSAAYQAISDGLTTLAATVSDSSSSSSSSGSTVNGDSPSALLAELQDALTTYQASPSSTSAADAVVAAAKNLVSSIKAGSKTVQEVREQADSQMNSDVSTVNSLLKQYSTVDQEVVSGLASGADVNSYEDTRDSLLSQISKYVGVSTTANTDGSVSVYTDTGVSLYQNGVVNALSFTPSATLTDGTSGNPVTVNGVAITAASPTLTDGASVTGMTGVSVAGASAPMATQTGELAGLAQLRDVVAPQYEAQLDQIACGLITAFAESDPNDASVAKLPGLFTYSGATALPSASSATGLADAIEVNAAVDPDKPNGDPTLLRDGGINGTSYVYNTDDASSYTGRIDDMIKAVDSTCEFDASAGLGTPDTSGDGYASAKLSDYASSSVSWLQAQNQSASDSADYQSSLLTQAKSALSNATGVSLDTELTNMLSIENSYSTTAKLLTTVDDMFTALLDAANPT